MIGKTTMAIGLALTLVVSSAALVQAGGGGWGIPIDVLALNCYTIAGENPPHEVALEDQFFSGDASSSSTPRRSPVALGKAKLLCTSTQVVPLTNDPIQMVGELTDHLVCYQTPARPSPNVLKKLSDYFGTQVVTVGSPAYTCFGALKCDATNDDTRCPALD